MFCSLPRSCSGDRANLVGRISVDLQMSRRDGTVGSSLGCLSLGYKFNARECQFSKTKTGATARVVSRGSSVCQVLGGRRVVLRSILGELVEVVVQLNRIAKGMLSPSARVAVSFSSSVVRSGSSRHRRSQRSIDVNIVELRRCQTG